MFSGKALGRIIELLRSEGVDGVIIGSTAIDMALKKDSFDGDIDMFLTSLSLLANYGVLEEFARKYGCVLGSTWLGTPNITCFVEGEEVVVDFYENMLDFYVPEEIIEDSLTYEISGTGVKAVRPEDYIVLKAVAGRDEDLEAIRRVKEYIESKKLKIDKKLIESRAKLFGEPQTIIRRLSLI
jgi:predicted nucleotidyltransferase